MSKTAEPRISEEGFGMLVTFSALLVRGIEDLGIFAIIEENGFDPASAYLAFQHSKEVDWDQVSLLDSFYCTVGALANLLACARSVFTRGRASLGSLRLSLRTPSSFSSQD